MELFYSDNINGGFCRLNEDESGHCVRVLRHRSGDEINVIGGEGTMYRCRIISDAPKKVEAEILDVHENWNPHPYNLTLAVCPTKNNDRYEWFVEKAVEIGVDKIVPVIGEHSERKVYKTERAAKIVLSATKQSLKAKLAEVSEPVTVRKFIESVKDSSALKLIAWCFEGQTERVSVKSILQEYQGDEVIIMIGPEGDFSPAEGEYAVSCGFVPVHLGNSRLRTETAALTAAEAVYFKYM